LRSRPPDPDFFAWISVWIQARRPRLVVVVAPGLTGPQHYLERYSNWPNLEVPIDEATIPSTSLKLYYPDLMR
jgi:hypothetical protein